MSRGNCSTNLARVVIFSIKYRMPKLLIFIGKDDFGFRFWLLPAHACSCIRERAAPAGARLAATQSAAGKANAHASSVEAKIKRGRRIYPSHWNFAASRLRVSRYLARRSHDRRLQALSSDEAIWCSVAIASSLTRPIPRGLYQPHSTPSHMLNHLFHNSYHGC